MNGVEGLAARKVEILAAVKPPGGDHEEAEKGDERRPRSAPATMSRSAALRRSGPRRQRCRQRRGWACRRSICVPVGPGSWARGLWLMLKRARRLAPEMRKRKADDRADVADLLMQAGWRWRRPGELREAPEISEQRGSDAESDDVGERVEFAAELAFGVGHARDAAVERVEGDGEADGDGGVIEVIGFRARSRASICRME